MRTPIFAALAITIALAAPALAEPCYTTSSATATLPTGVGLAGEGTYYVVVDSCTLSIEGCLFSVWLYEESNGAPGLQRQDEMWNDLGNCHDGTLHDTPLF